MPITRRMGCKCTQDMARATKNKNVLLYMKAIWVHVKVHVSFLLLGWVEVFRSGLKKYSDFLALGDVDWQLDQSLQAAKLDTYMKHGFTLCRWHLDHIITMLFDKNQRLTFLYLRRLQYMGVFSCSTDELCVVVYITSCFYWVQKLQPYDSFLVLAFFSANFAK